MAKIAIVYFSGYGHTARQAEAVREGAESVKDSEVGVYRINEAGDLPSGALEELKPIVARYSISHRLLNGFSSRCMRLGEDVDGK